MRHELLSIGKVDTERTALGFLEPLRVPGGISGYDKGNPLSLVPFTEALKWVLYDQDFVNYTAGDWTITKIDGGTDGAEVVAQGDANGGILTVTTNDASGDSEYIQKKGESFKLTAGKRTLFYSRFKLTSVANCIFLMGLQITDPTPKDASDGIWFEKDSGDALLDAVVKNTSATESAGLATLVDDTYVEAVFFYNGVNAVEFYVDGALKASLAVTNLPDTEVTVSFGIETATTAAKTATIDRVFVAHER